MKCAISSRKTLAPIVSTSHPYSLIPNAPYQINTQYAGVTHPDPHNLPDLTPPRLENRLDVGAARARLVRDAALDQFARVVCGELARDPDLRGGLDGLGVGGGRWGMEVSKEWEGQMMLGNGEGVERMI